jgi:hypothetical protein
MPAGHRGSGEDGWADLPWDPQEQLEHEIALAAALDRSRTDLSLDEASAGRMRADFFARLDAEWNAPGDTDQPVDPAAAETTVMRPIADPLALTSYEVTADLTAALRPDGPAAETRTESAGERVLASSAGNRKARRARHKLPASHPDNPGRGPGGRPSLRKRVALVGGAAALALVALAGGTAWMSGNALPGDSLYGVKLAAESTGTVFTFGDAAKAQRHLDLAATRLSEVEQLRNGGTTPSAEIYRTAMAAFDESASEGSRLLLAGAQPTGDTGPGDLDAWAHKQATALQQLGSVPGADQSSKLLVRLSERAAALQARMGCTEVSDGVDDLGPIPATGTCTPAPQAAGGSGSSARSVDRSTPQSARENSQSTGPSASTDPTDPSTDASTAPESTESGPLDGLLGGGSSADSGTTTDSSSSSTPTTTPSNGGSGGGGLLPPINLPPLLPGLPPITIG